VDYFDFYLMHAQNRRNYEKYKACRAYETAFALKEEGKVRHVGISFHDSADILDKILTDHPQIEVVQLQFNYLDFDEPSVQSRLCWEVCRKHGKPVIVMEPVKGGTLVNLPEEAAEVFAALGGSPASYAIRFAAGFEGIMMVLSGMSTLEMVEENCGFMADFKKLNNEEMAAANKVRDIFHAQHLIPCTACKYCTEVCPQGIRIPDLFADMNAKKQFGSWTAMYHYSLTVKEGVGPADCLKCGLCEDACPQNLKIRDLLEDVAAEFEQK
jgi:predicted aldo/keto reductase-like oxidoreductase